MKVVVFGANGPTGRLVTGQALDAGHEVTAVTRHPEELAVGHEHLSVQRGDVFNPADVHRVLRGQDAVLSTLGVPFSREAITVYSRGIGNILSAMAQSGTRRLVCVSSSAVDPAAGSHGGFLFEKVLQPYVVNVLGRTLYADMRLMEELVRNSSVDWTIVRPSGLFETPEPTDYRLAERYVNSKFTSRADLASSMLAQLSSDGYVGKIMAVGTFSSQPTLLQMLWREAVSKPKSQRPVERSRA